MRKLMIVGPALSRSGYGEQTRFAIESLKSSKKYDLYVHNIEWGSSTWISHDDPQRQYIDSLISKTVGLDEKFKADVSLQVTVPNEFKVYSPVNIGYTAGIETDKVDDSWVYSSNMMDGVLVPSQHSKSSFENASTSELPLSLEPKVVGFPYVDSASAAKSDFIKTIEPNLREYNFLTVAQVSPRKNIYNLVKWFLRRFKDDERMSLTLKLHKRGNSTIDKFETAANISAFVTEHAPKKKCSVNLVHGDLSGEEMRSLYNSDLITHYITTTHGEGFGLPIFEAAGAGKIIIAPAWSGQLDYLTYSNALEDPLFVPIEHSVEKVKPSAVWKGVINEDANWASVTEEAFTEAVDYSVENYNICKSRAEKLSNLIKKKFTKNKQSFIFNQAIEEFIKKKENN